MRGLHFGSCPGLAGMHVGFKWHCVQSGTGQDLGCGSWAARLHTGSASWEVGMLKWTVSEDSALWG